MRHKRFISALIAASVLYLSSVAADDGASGTVTADASAPAISKTLSAGSKDRPDLKLIERNYRTDPAFVNVDTGLLELALPIHGLPVYLTTLRLRI